jgi:hypothetical protein
MQNPTSYIMDFSPATFSIFALQQTMGELFQTCKYEEPAQIN